MDLGFFFLFCCGLKEELIQFCCTSIVTRFKNLIWCQPYITLNSNDLSLSLVIPQVKVPGSCLNREDIFICHSRTIIGVSWCCACWLTVSLEDLCFAYCLSMMSQTVSCIKGLLYMTPNQEKLCRIIFVYNSGINIQRVIDKMVLIADFVLVQACISKLMPSQYR